MKKKIRFISEIYYPETVSTGYIITKIAEGLTDEFDVSVICSAANYHHSSNAKNNILRETHNGVEINRIKTIDLDKNKFFQRILRQILVSIQLFLKICFLVKKNEILFIVTNPPTLIPLIILYKIIRGNKLVILVHDVFPDNLIAGKFFSQKTFFYRLLSRIYDFFLAKGDEIIVIGRDMKQIIDVKIKMTRSKVITNWSQDKEVFPLERTSNRLLTELKLIDKFVILFAGNLGRVQAIDIILEVAEKINDNNIHFLFIGDGALKTQIQTHIDTGNVKNVTLYPSFPREHQNEFLNACDIALISLNSGMLGLGVPSKTYNMLAAGKPLLFIGDEGSEVDLMIKEHQIGWSAPTANVEQIIYQILKAKSALNIEQKGKKSRELAEDNYSYTVVIEQFRQLLKNI